MQNGFVTLFTTAAELIEDLSNASRRGHLQESLTNYTHPHVLVIVEVGYLTYGPDAANVLFQVMNDRHLKKLPMIFITNKPLNECFVQFRAHRDFRVSHIEGHIVYFRHVAARRRTLVCQ
ncbi:MAG: hypothetical protein DMG50_00850 [Acidobacteria bacterium]|nr:MAG: hypothetical protein DMG50_00850 [Acidobacteriota bacterium]